MERCPVCGNESQNVPVCPVCGYDESRNYEQLLTLVPLDEAHLPSLAKKKADWELAQKAKSFEGLEISLAVYYYNLENDTLTLDREEELKLVDGAALVDGEIIWSDTAFPRIEDMDQLPVTIYVKNGEDRRRFRMVVDNPGGEEDWRVGVRYFAGSRPEAELVVRGEKTETSDRFSLEL